MRLLTGDALDILKTLESNSVDSLVTDPPAGIKFMGKKWDADKGGRKQWVAWLTEILVEVYRVLKPGAHGLVWALPKTAHWTGWALEEAGFEIRDNIVNHVFGQGMPKSHSVGKAIDKTAGAERETIGPYRTPEGGQVLTTFNNWQSVSCSVGEQGRRQPMVTAPATPEAEEWDGWGTALKPSQEIWWLVRKPLSEKTIADNVLKWGTGSVNIDAARIATGDSLGGGAGCGGLTHGTRHPGWERPWMADPEERERAVKRCRENIEKAERTGRWPGNVIFSHIEGDVCPDCEGECVQWDTKPEIGEGVRPCPTCKGTGEVGGCRRVGTKKVKSHNPDNKIRTINTDHSSCYGEQRTRTSTHHAKEGKETIEDWECVPECPVRQLDEQGGDRRSSCGGGHETGEREGDGTWDFYSEKHSERKDKSDKQYFDKGGASRFYYCPKAHTNERYFLCHTCGGVYPRKEIKAHKKLGHDIFQHPTQKPLNLMEYLARMVTPPGGTILDPFCGSGSTGVAARTQGFNFIGIDMDPDAIQIATYRTSNEPEPPPPLAPREEKPQKRTLLTMFKRK